MGTEDELTRATGKGILTSSENIGGKATHGKEALQQAATPNTVSQKIMMFETRSTPCLRQPTPPSLTSANPTKSKGFLATVLSTAARFSLHYRHQAVRSQRSSTGHILRRCKPIANFRSSKVVRFPGSPKSSGKRGLKHQPLQTRVRMFMDLAQFLGLAA